MGQDQVGKDDERKLNNVIEGLQRQTVALFDEQGGDPISVPPKDLTKTDLMGDLKLFLDLPAYQLAFPFTPTERHRTSLAQFSAGTIF